MNYSKNSDVSLPRKPDQAETLGLERSAGCKRGRRSWNSIPTQWSCSAALAKAKQTENGGHTFQET